MPVTLRYKDDGSGQPLAAVYATLEDARAQAEHDALTTGRVRDIIDGDHGADHAGNHKVLADAKEFDALNRRKVPTAVGFDLDRATGKVTARYYDGDKEVKI